MKKNCNKNLIKNNKPAAEMEENTNNLSRRIWTVDETKAFLDAYGKRRFEFESARLKKFAMRNVLEDLNALGVLTQVTTEGMLKVKLKNLMRAYKTTKDHNKRTGESFIRAPFVEQMDEIFGSQPIITNNHSINLCGASTEGLLMEKNCLRQPESTKPKLGCPKSSNAPMPIQIEEPNIQNIALPQPESSLSICRPAASKSRTPSGRRSRLNAKEKYYEMKERKAAERNEILRKFTENQIKKMDEAERAKEARLERKEKLLRELFNKP